jgi:hypothetical protein
LWSLQASPQLVHVPMHLVIPRPHTSMDHRYNHLPFSIQDSNSYSFTSHTFMLQGSHTGSTPVIPWGGSLAAEQPPTWLPPPPPAGYWPPLPPADHPGQSSSTSPHLSARDTGCHRRGYLQLKGKPHPGECLHSRHRRRSRSDLLLCHRR